MITEFNRIFTVEAFEYGYTVEDIKVSKLSDTIELYIPKIAGLIKSANTERIIIHNLFSNADDCQVYYDTKVYKTKTLEVPLQSNCNWDKITVNGIIPKNTRLIVEFINGSLLNPSARTI